MILWELVELQDCSTMEAFTMLLPGDRETENEEITDTIYGHIFGWNYDLWIKEYDPESEAFYGYASFGGPNDQCAEWGYTALSDILEARVGPMKLPLERDKFWDKKTLTDIKQWK